MQEINELNAKVSALESENGSLKQVIEQLQSQTQALDQTVMDLLRANIALKAGANMLERKVQSLMNDIAIKDQKIKALEPKPIENPPSE